MAAAVQPRADFLGDDLPRTARKSEEADQMRQLLALAVILDVGLAARPRAPAAGACSDPGRGVALQGGGAEAW